MNGTFVDDLLWAETHEWQDHLDAPFERLETAGNQQEPFPLAGMNITGSDNMYHIYLDLYMSNIERTPSDAKFSKFESMRMKLA